MIDQGKHNSTLEKIKSVNSVEGFYPEELAEQYTDLGSQETRTHLPVSAQVAWFRLKYPDGRIDPNIDYFGNGECVASCKVYADRHDPVDQYLAKNTATRRIDANMPSIPVRDWAITAAIGRALTTAGFGLAFDHSGDIYAGMVPAESAQQQQQSHPDNVVPFTMPGDPGEPVTVDQCQQVKIPDLSAATPAVSEPKRPQTLEDALNTPCSLSKFKGKTFQEILRNPQDAGIVKWIVKNPDRVTDMTLKAAQILDSQAKCAVR